MKNANHERFACDWMAAGNARDLERILSHYSEDAEFTSPLITKLIGVGSGTLHGKATLRDYFARGLAAYPELAFKLIRVHSGAGSCVLVYHSVKDLIAADTMEFDASGKICRVLAHYAPGP
jgi:ketosteroid isomerase-like protein